MTTVSPDSVFQYRPLLVSLAYRMLGQKQEAEDIVQDVYARWLEMDIAAVQQPRHYLMRAVTNRSINRLKTLQQQRASYTGPWLPEPLEEDPVPVMSGDRELSIGLLFLLEKLNPLERAVFLLRESFDVPYRELEEILDIPEANCRQLLHRAKDKLQQDKKRFSTDTARHRQLLEAFLDACSRQDQEGLIALLKEDISFYGDGGGKASAATHPLFGRDVVVKVLLGIFRKPLAPSPQFRFLQVNGQPALALFDAARQMPLLCICFEEVDGVIDSFYFIRNPDKLKNIRKK